MPIPKNNEMRLEVTTRCTYNCVICPREKITRKMETMDISVFKKLFDKVMSETDQYDTLTFSGIGEPLLDKGLHEKIEYAKTRKKDLTLLILTNSSLLSVDQFRDLEGLGLDSVRVSFYGTNADNYCRMHGVKDKDLFYRVRDNLVKISQIKNKTKLILTLNVTDEIGSDSVEEWINFWKDKTDLLEVWRPHNWVYGRNYRAVQADKLKTCGRPFGGPLQVQADGTVIMCCFDFDGKLTLGDLKKQTLSEIFSSPLYNKLAACHTSGDFKNSRLICEDCDQRNKDKSHVMIYNSKFNIEERVNQLSTTYKKVVPRI
jgi:MoaA/NifB/PqqE/SkfB family radical SAM enzyme